MLVGEGSSEVLRAHQTSYRDGDAPFVFEVQSEAFHALWNVMGGTMRIAEASGGWKWREQSMAPLYQSKLTQLVLAEMLDRGVSVLPDYAESAALHLSMLDVFLRHAGGGAELCAIT